MSKKKTLNHTNILKNFAFDAPYLSQDNHICTHLLFWEIMLTFDKYSTFFTTIQYYHLWSYLPQFVTTITHQTTNMTQPPMLTTCCMNESCWIKDHGSDSDSSSGPEGCNMSPSHEPIFK